MMSEHDSPEQDIQVASIDLDRIGPTLVVARENLGFAAEDIANRLRLSLRQVQALENDDFAVLPEAVITRGFIRNYARLVNIDATPLLRVYSQYVPAQDGQAISIPSANIVISGEPGMSWRPYVWFGVLLVVLLAAWVLYVDFFQKHDAAPALADSPVSSIVEQESVSEGQALENAAPSEPVSPASAESAVAPEQAAPSVPAAVPQTTTEPATSPAQAAMPQPSSSEGGQALPQQSSPQVEGSRLKFSVTEETWVSVFDGNGKQILNKTLAPSSEEMIAGQPPFRIVVGNIHGTKLEYNNSPVDLAPYTKVNVARLRLE
ncbi:RodZ domain-containing protein [Methylobacillus methanolivorans]|uniref:RodZ domain-containing protein n=1 Tax=Methylobacillus methanolivorans TaxID=1848927 RepID=A0ABW8GJ25_9PROT